MRLICMWCAVMAAARAQDDFYTPQTFKQHVRGALFQPMHQPWNMPKEMDRLESYQKGMFTPALRNDVDPQASQNWRPSVNERDWRGSPSPLAPAAPLQPILQPEPWRPPFSPQLTKEQQAAILHHKQALTSDGAFRFEYASDNGLAAGEQIEPDGTRVGAYQYKDPSGQIVKLKYRAGKEGFQILEGSHLPKSPEPVAPPTSDQHYQQAYQQQRQQYDLQQQYNQQRIEPQQQNWQQNTGGEGALQRATASQYYPQSWRAQGQEDDGQYRPQENEVQSGPHNFGEGFAFSFQG
ncbi:uncharacterized protein LOC134676417 [Cydia fagiglandana]|uniref:uncharacterized protein LOC134676417 n=1 Tax=Cydia fagiglandana TaxID=1458189 RepID=UPI002FEE4D55